MKGGVHHIPHIYSSSLLFFCNSYTKAECDPGQEARFCSWCKLLRPEDIAEVRLKVKVPEYQLSGPETISRALESGQNPACISEVSYQ